MTPQIEHEVRPYDALEERTSDLGNARRLARLAGRDLRYVHGWKQWRVWDDRRWAADHTGEVERRAKWVVESIAIEAANESNEDQRRALLRHALHSQGARAIRNMVQLAESEGGVAVPPDVFDRDPSLLNVANGTLELGEEAILRPHRREDYLTKLVPVPYDAAATCPTFTAFLERIFAGRRGLIEYVQRAVGYSLTGRTSEQVLLLCHGGGANGKTTLMQTIKDLLADYSGSLAAETLLARKGDVALAMNDLASLQGTRFVVAVESDMGRRLAEGLVKSLTGGEAIRVKRLYADVYSIMPTFKLWIGTNHKPDIRGRDLAIWRRIKLIPFDVVIPTHEQDHRLIEKLEAERPGILRWAVEGYLAWRRQGLGAVDEVERATAAYQGEMDSLGEFLADRCVIERGCIVPAGQLFEAYVDWAKKGGETMMSKRALGVELANLGFLRGRKNGQRAWIGVRLRSDLDDDVSGPVTQSDADF